MDPRLRAAVDASRRWYDAIFASHGIPAVQEDGLWWARAQPPRWHSAAKSTEPDASAERALRAVEPFEHCSVADSFGSWDLSAAGFELLLEATWFHHPPLRVGGGAMPPGWSVTRDERTFERWNAEHDTTGVLLPSLLTDPEFVVLAHHVDGTLVGGAVLHDSGSSTVELSNQWTLQGTEPDPEVILGCIAALRPGRAVVGYARGDELDRLSAAGFSRLGPQVVWVR